MHAIPQEEVERVWRELESGIKRLEPLISEFKVYQQLLITIAAARKEPIERIQGELRSVCQQLTPRLPGDVWRRISTIAKNLGQPMDVVLGDLILKAISGDPSELVEYRLKFSEEMLGEGEKFLREGDVAQASEKFWNAVVQALKAVAATEEVELKSHRDLWEYVNKLVREHGDREIARLFANVEHLHRNFYERHLPRELVVEYIEDSKRLVEKLKQIIARSGRRG